MEKNSDKNGESGGIEKSFKSEVEQSKIQL